MSANVETMFYVREKPWHGLGTLVMEAPASADALVWAGLDWKVIQKEVRTEDGAWIAGYKANIRSTDGSVLGIVSDRYKVVQNEDAFRFPQPLGSHCQVHKLSHLIPPLAGRGSFPLLVRRFVTTDIQSVEDLIDMGGIGRAVADCTVMYFLRLRRRIELQRDTARGKNDGLAAIFPGIRLALTCQISGAEREQLDGIIDFWLPAGGYVWEKGRKISEGTFWGPPLGFYDRQKDKGAVIYPYQCSVPVRSRDPLGYFRMFGWRAFNIGADGIAVFTGNDNLYHNLNEFGGELIGTRGWEAFRNGVQDWQYCHLLMQEIGRIETKNPEAAVRMKKHLERIFRKLFEAGPFPDGTAESVARVNAAKYAVADMILDARKLK